MKDYLTKNEIRMLKDMLKERKTREKRLFETLTSKKTDYDDCGIMFEPDDDYGYSGKLRIEKKAKKEPTYERYIKFYKKLNEDMLNGFFPLSSKKRPNNGEKLSDNNQKEEEIKHKKPTHQDKFKKIMDKAAENGYYTICSFEDVFDRIIFSHDFAEAYWKDDMSNWQYRLQELVCLKTTEDRIDYLYKFI
jgi:hypothetical protein